jgi:hypothetical protein
MSLLWSHGFVTSTPTQSAFSSSPTLSSWCDRAHTRPTWWEYGCLIVYKVKITLDLVETWHSRSAFDFIDYQPCTICLTSPRRLVSACESRTRKTTNWKLLVWPSNMFTNEHFTWCLQQSAQYARHAPKEPRRERDTQDTLTRPLETWNPTHSRGPLSGHAAAMG